MSDDDDTSGGGKKKFAAFMSKPAASLKHWHVVLMCAASAVSAALGAWFYH